ncbi:NUDIX domain-containing protein [Plantibacter sp. ME-Dv--P-095]|uniref:NUDIX domain-containing protein n=1 Tax=Plantibacter sp. ME-Dv--P-095 TaxID=3040299 RepID=UPI00254FA25D|nr:NUDIX domain-containing protein [Plantibacter sp. ME-Dv--P-095]
MRPVVLSGGPAVGKSTCGRLLARELDRAAFIDVDDIRQLVVSGEATLWSGDDGVSQHLLAARNASAMARNLLEDGFAVVIADVVTPEALAVYRAELPDCLVVHLTLPLDEAHERATTRAVYLSEDEFDLLHALLTPPPDVDHVIDVSGMTVDQQLQAIRDVWASLQTDGRVPSLDPHRDPERTDGEIETGWSTRSTRTVFEGRVTLVEHEVEVPGGSRLGYLVDESVPFSVASLIVDGDDVILARQYRYPVDRWIYDLPGGGGRGEERPIDAARRELEEELGLIVDDLRPLHTFFMNPGRAAWPTHLFISTSGLRAGHADTSDPGEQVRLVRMPLIELDQLITDGTIVDPPLMVARAAAAARGLLPPLRPIAG